MIIEDGQSDDSLDFFISSWITSVSFNSLKEGHDFYINDESGFKKLTMEIAVHVVKVQRELNGIIHACAEFYNSLMEINSDPIKNILLSERLYENCVVRIRAYQEKIQTSSNLLAKNRDVISKIGNVKTLIQRCLSQSMGISKHYIGTRNEILHERGYSVPRGDLAIIMEVVIPDRRDEMIRMYGFSSPEELMNIVRDDFAVSYNNMHKHIDVFESEFSILCDTLKATIRGLEEAK